MGTLTPERWQKVQEILDTYDDLDATERPAFLAEACGGDPALRHDVETLLENDHKLDSFLARPLFPICCENLDDGVLVPRIGPYKLIRELGEGGMGTVYLAAQEEPFRRRVALKLIQPEVLGRDTVRRFEGERAILARIRHPNVAHLYDGGTTPDGRPYFAMEYVEGKPIEEYCAARNLSRRQRLELFLQVASAVHLAHQKLRVVHRDLKPGNILVTADGTAKLLDFGIARPVADGPGLEEAAEGGGATSAWTPHYSSPEQLAGEVLTTASDIYSLGVLLYRLLTGRLPYRLDAADPATVLRTVRGEEPARPRLDADLDAMLLKALAREPEERYASVEQFAEDVRRYLSGLPLWAREPTFLYRAGKFVRRHRLRLASVAALVVLTLGLIFFQAREIAQVRRVSTSLVGLLKALQPATPDQKVEIETVLVQADLIVNDPMFARRPLDQALLMDALGWSYTSLGHYDEAEPLLVEALATRRQLLGADDQRVAESLNNLALLYQITGKLAQAASHLREALAIYDRNFEPDAAGLRAARANLAIVLYKQGRYTEAVGRFRQLLEQRRALLGDDHPKVVQTRSNLASALVELGAYDEAEPLVRYNLEVRLRLHGAEHRDVVKSRNQLLSVLYALGDFAAAEREAREALHVQSRIYGPDHPEVALVLNNLGRILQARGTHGEAEGVVRRALTIFRQRFEETHPHVAVAQANLAAVLTARGDPVTAEVLARRAVATLRIDMAPGSWRIANMESVLGATLAGQGRFEEAEELLVKAFTVICDARGEKSPNTRAAARRLVDLYGAWGRPQEAASYRRLAARPHHGGVASGTPGAKTSE